MNLIIILIDTYVWKHSYNFGFFKLESLVVSASGVTDGGLSVQSIYLIYMFF